MLFMLSVEPISHSSIELQDECWHVMFVNDVTEVDIITSVVYAESAGEYYEHAQDAILDVISNRMSSNYFPNSPLGVVLQKRQFDGKWESGYKYHNTERYDTIKQMVIDWYNSKYKNRVLGSDYCWYYNPKTSTNNRFVNWANTRNGVIIGNHRFFK